MLHCGVRALRVCQKWQRCHRLLLVTADRGPRYSIAADVGKRKRTVEVADATPLAAASMDLPVRRSASNLAVMTEASNDDALIATQAISVSTSRRKGAVKVDVLSKDVSEKMLPNARAVKAKKRIPAIKQEDAEVELKAAEEQREGSPGDPFTGNGTGGDEDEPPKEEELKEAAFRPPPVHSDYLPLPWKGRLGYACLNTYLRYATPPVFSSRTCRIASIIENRHPLKDPSQPAHAIKNRPDREQPADIERGRRYVENLGLLNARDVIKTLKWNDRYGIRFLRLSSEMFPFASHEEYGYKLAPFASEVLADVGRVVAELGHRVTTHPGQFTQLGSPRNQVVDAAMRDLEYHDEMLSLLKLPPQQDRDAVMIIHMGGVFGSKPETLNRFRQAYPRLSPSVKRRLVLENDDVSWTVHDLLPICEELNIPLVLDYHHHNILFDADKVREGTKDVILLYDRISETWRRKEITQKMHYSEPGPTAITARQRRKHSPRVATMPPCPNTMDLMIEAKDKEQAVFELMRNFKLPGFDSITDMIPNVRGDDNRPLPKKAARPKKKKRSKAQTSDGSDEDVEVEEVLALELVGDEEFGMGGPQNRVYWPPGMEEWLRPVKRVVKKKVDPDSAAPTATPLKGRIKERSVNSKPVKSEDATPPGTKMVAAKTTNGRKKLKRSESTPSGSDPDADAPPKWTTIKATPATDSTKSKLSRRASHRKREANISYAEANDSN